MITYEEDVEAGTATVHFENVRGYRMFRDGTKVTEMSVTVPRSAYRVSRDSNQRAAERMERALSDAQSTIERLTEERDEWQERALRGEAALSKYPVRVMLGSYEVHADHVWTDTDRASADVLDAVAATAPVGSLVDDLKNTIVSQAREIARLKGERE
ncbi:hypothetical protein [Streptomyces sp. NPDC004528]|uniref:hypothetical protein n=1 Tax=Streptomyces sp. NPDC004528 TaxID=3154550 RepID=UPI0033A15727